MKTYTLEQFMDNVLHGFLHYDSKALIHYEVAGKTSHANMVGGWISTTLTYPHIKVRCQRGYDHPRGEPSLVVLEKRTAANYSMHIDFMVTDADGNNIKESDLLEMIVDQVPSLSEPDIRILAGYPR